MLFKRRGGFVAALLALTVASGCVADMGPPPGPPPGPFPNLTEAESSLQAAIASLRRAPPAFGGHKAEAVRLIEAAIGEVERAKAFAER